jgi:peptide/nickel transport system substrate-binding protein
MRFTRRSMFGATAVTAGALALASCSKDDGSTSGGAGGTGGDEQIESGANAMNPKKRDELGEGGQLRLFNNAFPANWNPMHLDGAEENTSKIRAAILPSLTKADAAGEITNDESCCKRLELTSEDPQVMEIELQPDMKWSDGTPIDYKSIENVFKICSGDKKFDDYVVASTTGYEQVEKIEQGDSELIAKITFKEKFADWKGLASVAPDSLVESAKAFNEGWLQEPKVTAGPFKVKKIDSKNKTVLLEQDENWWGDKPLLDQVLFTTIEDPAASATSYKNDQLDSIDPSTPAQYTVLEPLIDQGSVLLKAAGPDWTHLTLNGQKGRPLEDPKVRQAVFRAIKREDVFLSVNATMPYPKDFPQLNNHLLMTNQEGYKDNSGDYGKYDPDAAKKLLEDAGYTIEDDKATKDGKPLELTYVYNDGSKVNEAVVPVIKEALEAVGITTKVQKVPPSDLFSKYVGAGEYDLTLFGWIGTPELSSGDSIWKQDGGQNYTKVGSDEIDKLIDAASAETDEKKRLDLVNQADAKIWELANVFPLWQSYTFVVQNEDLANFGAPGFADVDWTLVGYTKGSDKLK